MRDDDQGLLAHWEGSGSALRAIGIDRSGGRGENHSTFASAAALNHSSVVIWRPRRLVLKNERRRSDRVIAGGRHCRREHEPKKEGGERRRATLSVFSTIVQGLPLIDQIVRIDPGA